MIGTGKYHDLATTIQEGLAARGIVLVVIDGALGTGCSCKLPTDPQLATVMADSLRNVADGILADVATRGSGRG